jgi:lysozyme
MRRTNRQGIEIVQGFESCELEAYPDPASALYRACQASHISPMNSGYRRLPGWDSMDGGPWTIGWGHTGPDVTPGLVITQDEADGLLVSDLAAFEAEVEAHLGVDPTGNQFSALVCFAYNCKGWQGSTLLRKFNAGDIEGAAAEFGRWTRAGGRVLRGLVRRREAECQLFLAPGDGDSA